VVSDCFNPRPRRGAGATSKARPIGTRSNVSILARAEARALRHSIAGTGQAVFVSILARAEARALLNGIILSPDGNMFQSSPAPRRGRYAVPVNQPAPFKVFQSSPAPRRGRYDGDHGDAPWNNSFQSSPAPRRGRYTAFSGVAHTSIVVSILARAEARALP